MNDNSKVQNFKELLQSRMSTSNKAVMRLPMNFSTAQITNERVGKIEIENESSRVKITMATETKELLQVDTKLKESQILSNPTLNDQKSPNIQNERNSPTKTIIEMQETNNEFNLVKPSQMAKHLFSQLKTDSSYPTSMKQASLNNFNSIKDKILQFNLSKKNEKSQVPQVIKTEQIIEVIETKKVELQVVPRKEARIEEVQEVPRKEARIEEVPKQLSVANEETKVEIIQSIIVPEIVEVKSAVVSQAFEFNESYPNPLEGIDKETIENWEFILFNTEYSKKMNFNNIESQILNQEFDTKNQKIIKNDCERTRVKDKIIIPDFRNEIECFLTYYCKQHDFPYKQGLNEIAAPFLFLKVHIQPIDTGRAYNLFSAFTGHFFQNLYNEADFFSLQSSIKLLNLLLNYHDPLLSNLLDYAMVLPEMYATSWILTALSRYDYIHYYLIY